MNTNKRDEELTREEQDKKDEAQKNAFDNGQSPKVVKMNPNPRANGNLTDKERKENKDTTGAGSEITDGEDG